MSASNIKRLENVAIRPVQLNDSDLEALQQIGQSTFAETFLPFNPSTSIDKYIERKFNRKQLIAELDNAESQFFFAEIDNKVIGYLKVNSGAAQTEQVLSCSMEIERIYVYSEFHGQKVGQLLLDLALQIAERENKQFVWLGVWKQNIRAVKFYKKNGFIEFDKHIFMMGDKQQTDILMKLNLQNNN